MTSGHGTIPVSNLPEEIDRIVNDTLLAGSVAGIDIEVLEPGAVIYRKNASTLLHPASNMKLLTTAAAVRLLSPDFTVRTVVSADSDQHAGTLRSNLYVTGAGDPLIDTTHLDSIAAKLSSMGITTIQGNLVGDVRMFDNLWWGSGWMWDDEPSTDAPFLTPLTVDRGSVTIRVSPGPRTGDTLRWSLDAPGDLFRIENSAITSADTTLPPLEADRLKHENTITLRGALPPRAATQEYSFSVWRPEFFFLNLLRHRLLGHGIRVTGSDIIDTTAGLRHLAVISSPLDSILHRVNKPSDNLAAENLLRILANQSGETPARAVTGLRLIKEYLASAGADTTKLILADGSGLSWYNAVPPETIIRLLREQARHHDTFRRFYESLPVSGVDGTLKSRMRGTRAERNVHAKTGSLTGVSSLSGYVTSADDRTFVFSLIWNHVPGELSNVRRAQDRIMHLLSSTNIGNP